MVKVVIERDVCTSCASCWSTCPEFFEENPDDSFSQVIEKFRVQKKIHEGEAPDELATCVMDAADLCPVSIIHVED